MMPAAIFHLSFPVSSLPTALAFYQRCLGAVLGRVTGNWADVILFGHQITLHEQPAQVLPRAARGVRHFGAILDRATWDAARDRVLAYDPALVAGILQQRVGGRDACVKFLLEDPDGNLIELKTYTSVATVSDALAG